ncbi:hypothetical protein MHB81_24350 [Paenibacillus sp. FSL H7-0326]
MLPGLIYLVINIADVRARDHMATIGLFSGIAYWNDWNNGLIYLTDPQLYSIQNLLNQMMQKIEVIKTSSSVYGASSNAMELPSETVRMAIAFVGILLILVAYPSRSIS